MTVLFMNENACSISLALLPMQSVPITTNVHRSSLWVRNPLRWGVLDATLCDQVCQWLAAGWWFYQGTSLSSDNKTEMLLNVALNTITLTFMHLGHILYIWCLRMVTLLNTFSALISCQECLPRKFDNLDWPWIFSVFVVWNYQPF